MKLAGSTDIEDSLDRLDKLTQEEARMASAELLKLTHSVEGQVQDVRSDVHNVGNKVQGVDDRVQGIRSDIKDISSEVRGVDDKLDHVNRSLSFQLLLLIASTHTSSQGTNSEIVFYDGFRPQIHPLIITLLAKLITTVQLDGFFKAVYSINGNPLTPSCGYTENVRYSWPSPCDDPDHLLFL